MAKKLSNDDFIRRCKTIFGNKLDFSETEYVNNRTKVKITCNKCGNVFYKSPKTLLLGQGCPTCSINSLRERQKSNYNAFVEKANAKFNGKYSFPNIENEYSNNKDKITIHCNCCDSTFVKTANDFLSSKDGGCKKCRQTSQRKRSEIFSYEDLAAKVQYNWINVVNFDGTKGKEDAMQLYCKKHKCLYKKKVAAFLKGHQLCENCIHETHQISEEDTFERLKGIIHGKLTIFCDTFQGFNKPMRFKCNECGYEFDRKPSTFIYGKLKGLCPQCVKNKTSKLKTKTTNEFIQDAVRLYGKDKFDFSETTYEKSSSKVTVKCNECGRYFSIEANSFLQGHGCPFHNCNSSIMEKELTEFVKGLGFECISNDRTIINGGKEIDCLIPSKKIAIEFDGLYWHNELNKDKFYHLSKTNECAKNGYRLIHIFEDEWINKNEIWKSMISNFLGACKNKIYARKCTIMEVEAAVSNEFLSKNHLQGKCEGSVRLGLFHENELVSLMVLGKTRHFIGNGKGDWELLRFCSKINTVIIGGASKLLKYFTTNFSWKNIVSYADKRWSNGELYHELNFIKYNESQPNYYYVIGNERKFRFNFRKSILVKKYNCPTNMSEHDFCLSKKWFRIYDCGCLCFILNNKS